MQLGFASLAASVNATVAAMLTKIERAIDAGEFDGAQRAIDAAAMGTMAKQKAAEIERLRQKLTAARAAANAAAQYANTGTAPDAVQVKTIYEVPALPAIPSNLFPKTEVKAVTQATAPAPLQVTPITSTLSPLSTSYMPTSLAPIPAPAPAAPVARKSSLPSWLLPAGIAAAALAVVTLIQKRKR